jgi:hypothetical protein
MKRPVTRITALERRLEKRIKKLRKIAALKAVHMGRRPSAELQTAPRYPRRPEFLFRTDGPWGQGVGLALEHADIDQDIWALQTYLRDIVVRLDRIEKISKQWSTFMAGYTRYGPSTYPYSRRQTEE